MALACSLVSVWLQGEEGLSASPKANVEWLVSTSRSRSSSYILDLVASYVLTYVSVDGSIARIAIP